MKTKIFYAFNEKTVESKVNDFLENSSVEVIDLKFSATVFYFSVLILYREN
ncbi:hypothetical protein Amet_1893 [Alkaliphilus metalliredigens QYMF]|uniref:Sporulation protein Cse60 n=1 Tax=Alkaliphilus metalliredigens (strain QYMF) TaxID=293826 RepID=A6TPE0_ALKMQ|nr:hypothetical protein [Alkaliphilus metalliredigens]ABR48058.1 hypothetical protein Amet_1893 [Alkaliphilus metalliredigens QYMF]